MLGTSRIIDGARAARRRRHLVQGTCGPADRKRVGQRKHSLWNNTFQYKIFKNFRLAMEVNFTHYYYYGGNGKIVPTSHPGQTLVYLTRGLVLGRFRLKDRLSFTVGAVLRSRRRHFISQTTFLFYLLGR
jgi:hypothetical protein